MKAKNLVLGSPVYRAETDKITIVRVIALKMILGNVRISLSGYSSDKDVPPDAEAIIPQNDYEVRYYFDLKSAQVRQLRLRWDAIEARKKNLENAAQLYAETYAKYHNVPPSEPVEQ